MTETETPPPTLNDVLVAYQRALVARVQLEETDPSWSHGLTAGFRKTIARHLEIEKAYLAAVTIRRKESTEELRRRMDQIDVEHRKRQLDLRLGHVWKKR